MRKMDQDVVSKEIAWLKAENIELKNRLRRIENFLSSFPNLGDNSSPKEPKDDELIEKAIEIVKQSSRASASLLQRSLAIGYARASKLLDILEQKGIVGPAKGVEPRKVLTTNLKD